MSLMQKGAFLIKDAKFNEVKRCLYELTDDDFNGNNEEYVELDNVSMSYLDACLTKYSDYSDNIEYISKVLDSCYSHSYYDEYSIFTKEVDNGYVIVISFI